MCLIIFAHQVVPAYPLVLLANRDEFHQRPSEAARFWPDNPGLLAGRDLQAGGTWLGITRTGRFAAVTNFREGFEASSATLSRGMLTCDYLLGDQSPQEYLATLPANNYDGFNLLLGDGNELFYYSNRGASAHRLSPGIYGLSNHLLNTRWPKVTGGKSALEQAISRPITAEQLTLILQDHDIPDDEHLPDTGVGIEWERLLSSRFIRSAEYGTRCSTVLLIDNNDGVVLRESSYNELGQQTGVVEEQFAIARD
jgi:uncharacterized protein with NRDE domain